MDNFNEHLGIEFRIDKVGKGKMSNGEEALILYLIVDNKSSKIRKINLSKATYITSTREQIEQDIWLSGFIIGEAELRPNSFKQAGLIFYTSNLEEIALGDIFFIKVVLPKEGIELTLSFKSSSEGWIINDIKQSEIKIQLTLKQLEKILLQKVERLEAFEEKLEVSFQNVSVKIINDQNDFSLFFEVHSTNGTTIKNSICIECTLYSNEGLILEKANKILFPEKFFGFEVMDFYSIGNAEEVNKIRLYPKIR